MARIRTLKPEFFKDEEIHGLPMEARLLFQGLWLLADREGRLEDRPRFIHAEIFPYDANFDINSLLNLLAEQNFVFRYEIKGKKFIEIKNFLKHLRPNSREPKSEIPARARTRTHAHAQEEGKGRGTGKEREGDKGTASATRVPKTPDEFLKSLRENPAYKSIDIDRELAKMDAWLQTPKGKRRQKTKGFILNWLNRIDTPIDGGSGDPIAEWVAEKQAEEARKEAT
jgi:hypothetical protein